MDHVFVVKWIHVLSSTVLFGTGLGTAYFMWSAHRTGEPATIAAVAKLVVRADWLFTATTGVVQLVTGLMLMHGFGYDKTERWIIWSIGLYLLALACWVPVVKLQIDMRDLATEAATAGSPLPPAYHRAARLWFALGWPAFVGLLVVFYLMITRPA
jgi:uncharacterized membrane protein